MNLCYIQNLQESVAFYDWNLLIRMVRQRKFSSQLSVTHFLMWYCFKPTGLIGRRVCLEMCLALWEVRFIFRKCQIVCTFKSTTPMTLYCFIKQETNGPHRSPEKQFKSVNNMITPYITLIILLRKQDKWLKKFYARLVRAYYDIELILDKKE